MSGLPHTATLRQVNCHIELTTFSPNAPAGSRFSRTGLSASPHERMYHSTAILLADGSILVSGSNPNADVTTVQWGTSYVVEKWYPLWYSKTRPTPSAFPDSLSYGGAAWNLTYTPTNSSSNPGNTKVVVIRTGFSTHCVSGNQSNLDSASSLRCDEMLTQRPDELWPAIPRTGDFVQPRPSFGPGHTLRLADASERQHLPAGSCHDLPRRRRRTIHRTGEPIASHRIASRRAAR